MKQNKSVLFAYFSSPYHNAIKNNALEDYLLSTVNENAIVLLLYINTPAVILGRNQNPCRETNPDFLNSNSIVLSRRLSGGGTVFHDAGVLNYAFIYKNKLLNKESIFLIIASVFKDFTIPVFISDRGSIETEGKKISGTAYGYRKNRVLHHGSILINADLCLLNKALIPFSETSDDKSVVSVHSEVINCSDLRNITVEDFKDALCTKTKKFIASKYEVLPLHFSWFDTENKEGINNSSYESLFKKYSDYEWIMGNYGKNNSKILIHK